MTTPTKEGALQRAREFCAESKVYLACSIVLKWGHLPRDGFRILTFTFDPDVARFSYDREARDLRDSALALYHDGAIVEYLENGPPSVAYNPVEDLEARLTIAEESIAALRDKASPGWTVYHCMHCGRIWMLKRDSVYMNTLERLTECSCGAEFYPVCRALVEGELTLGDDHLARVAKET